MLRLAKYLVSSILLLTGCGTTVAYSYHLALEDIDKAPGLRGEIPYYLGTTLWIELMSWSTNDPAHGLVFIIALPFFLIDFIPSLCADTLLLPFIWLAR